ncbi:MAG: hypothetical protein KGP35_07505 [Bacteroidetes bacterium]|nr:hypothetical protein [Bacteroidota bacterium]
MMVGETEIIYMVIAAAVVFTILGWYLRKREKKAFLMQQAALANRISSVSNTNVSGFISTNPEMRRLQLQAYERCIILCERMGFTALLEKTDARDLTAFQLKASLIQQIKTEFEYNLSQQLYLSPAAWDALLNFKEQQIFILTQIGSLVNENAAAQELVAKIMEFMKQDDNASLQPIVAELLRKEARLLIQ